MKKFITRTISGVLLVIIVVGAFLLGEISSLLFVMLVFAFSFYEFGRMFKVKDRALFILLLILGIMLLVLVHLHLGHLINARWINGYTIFAVTAVILYSLLSSKTSFRDVSLMTLSMIWISGSMGFLLASGWHSTEGPFNPMMPLSLIVLIWINDVGAYLAGTAYGKRKLAPEISPAKTWEGFISGLILTGAAGWLIFLITDTFSITYWVITASLISLSAVTGDLFESKLKREAGVKDSGSLIPGHGGMLDRFDSLLFSAPIFYGLIILWELL